MENESVDIRTVHPNRLTRRGIVILTVIGILLLALALYHLPWPTHIRYTMPGAEVDLEGNVIDSGELVIEGWVYSYLFQYDRFQLTRLELPNREIGRIYEFSYYDDCMHPRTDIYMTYAWLELPEYTSQLDSIAYIFHTEDRSCWVIALTDRIYAGTTDPSPDYDEIMDFWADVIDGLIDN